MTILNMSIKTQKEKKSKYAEILSDIEVYKVRHPLSTIGYYSGLETMDEHVMNYKSTIGYGIEKYTVPITKQMIEKINNTTMPEEFSKMYWILIGVTRRVKDYKAILTLNKKVLKLMEDI